MAIERRDFMTRWKRRARSRSPLRCYGQNNRRTVPLGECLRRASKTST